VRRVTALGNQIKPERTWRGETIRIEVEDNNIVLMEFASGALVTAVGADCTGSPHIPWGGIGLYGTQGSLEVPEVDGASGYPTRFEIQGGGLGQQQYAESLSAQPYLRGEHLTLEEPHVYADIMDLVDAIIDDRAPRATGEQARHVIEIIEKARLAIQTGQTQSLTSTMPPAA
jgi:predicted dehydrogenase